MQLIISRLYSSLRRIFPSAGSLAVFTAIAASMAGWPRIALAQNVPLFSTGLTSNANGSNTIGDMICNAYINLGPFVDLFDVLAYLFGAALIGWGAVMLRDHAENPQNNPLHRGIARIAGGAGLVSLPIFSSFLVNTLFMTPGGGGNTTCTPGGVVAANGGGVGLDVLMTNFVNNIEGPILAIIGLGAFVMGGLFIIRGLIKGSKYGTDPRANSVPHILAYLIIGSILIALAENFSQVFGSIFGATPNGNIFSMATNANTVLNWTSVQDLGGSAPFVAAITAALTFFQIIGLIAFFRGWYIVKNAVEGAGQATMAQGFTHIIGGVLAINIYRLLEIFDTTFGTGLLL